MEENLIYASEQRENKILGVFTDQKLKYKLEELPQSKIQGLAGMNYYTLIEVLNELSKKGRIVSRVSGKSIYWRLI